MKCPFCKARINNKSNFCKYCGKQLVKNITIKESNPRNNEIIKQNIEYKKTFIGDNYKTFKSNFNIWAFLLGGIYLFYRKLYIIGLLVIILVELSLIKTPIIALIIHILIGFLFNKLYLKYSYKKISEIKVRNTNKTNEEKLDICFTKGNYSYLSGMLGIVISLIGIVIILNLYGTNIIINNKSLKETSNKNIYNLNYKLDDKFTSGNYNTNDYKTYIYKENSNYCRIKLSVKENKNQYDSIESFLTNIIITKQTDTVTIPEEVQINNNTYYKLNVENSSKTTTYYSIKDDKYYYLIQYDTYKDNTICKEKYEEFINSLTLK